MASVGSKKGTFDHNNINIRNKEVHEGLYHTDPRDCFFRREHEQIYERGDIEACR